MDDGVLINMDELIDQYAPNFWDIVRSRGEKFNQEIRGDGGAIIKFGTIWLPEFVNDRTQTGFMVRKDWMTEWGLEAPTTLDEFTELLRAFKEHGVEVPLAISNFLDTVDNGNYNIIAGAFGVAFKDFTLDEEGNVVYTRIDPAYKDFLTYMNGLVNEGLIDRDFITRKTSDALKLFYNGRAGMTYFHSSNYRDAMAAYILTRSYFRIRKLMTKAMIFTMYFSGGIIPLFIIVTSIKIYDTPLAVILPTAISTYNVIITRTFFQNIPESMEESAIIDGAGDWTIYARIIMPLSKAVIAVISLYYAVGHWNSWFNAMIFLRDRTLYPLQLFLRELLILNNSANEASSDFIELSMARDLVKYCTIIVSTVPILLVYPFAQRYFVQGVMIGAVKG